MAISYVVPRSEFPVACQCRLPVGKLRPILRFPRKIEAISLPAHMSYLCSKHHAQPIRHRTRRNQVDAVTGGIRE